MRNYLLALFLCACVASGQSPDTLTNETIIKMVQAGVPTGTIIRTIAAAEKTDFGFLPNQLQQLQYYKVPDDVVKAMAAKDKGLPIQGSTPTTPAAPAPAPAAIRPAAQPRAVGQTPPIVVTQTQSQPGPRREARLASGRIEIRGFGGANGGPDRSPFSDASYSLGGEVAVDLLRYLAVTGTYSYDDIGSFGIVSEKAHEFMGGIRVPFPNRSVVTPYVQTSIGGVHLVANAGNILGVTISAGTTKFAVAPGGGIDFKVTRHFGLGIDIRAIKPVDIKWQYRATGVAFFRF